jgi:hypothetical protein
MAALMGLVPVLWDYYLIDAVVFGLCGVSLPSSGERQIPTWFARVMCYGAAAALVSINIGFVQSIKEELDRDYAAVSLCERAIRAQQIDVSDIKKAPFGYRGWHLFPYFVAMTAPTAALSGFRSYIRRKSVRIRADLLKSHHRQLPAEGCRQMRRSLRRSSYQMRTAMQRRYQLRRKSRPAPFISINPATYKFDTFPMNNDEWMRYLSGSADEL